MNAISESVKIFRESGLNEKQLLAHLEVIERNMREHAVSPQEFNEFRIEIKNEFSEFRNEVNDKFNKVDAKFNELDTNLNEKFKKIDEKFLGIDERLIKLEQKIDKAIFRSTGILISFIALLQFFNK
jgi:predicted  nucleic acid-binding Zn-ribbon protein